jgi:hypothetical protein
VPSLEASIIGLVLTAGAAIPGPGYGLACSRAVTNAGFLVVQFNGLRRAGDVHGDDLIGEGASEAIFCQTFRLQDERPEQW